jgi:hypothetical protein
METPKGYDLNKVYKNNVFQRIVWAPQVQTIDIQNQFVIPIFPWIRKVKFPTAVGCVKPHLAQGNKFFIKIDLKAAFGSVTQKKTEKAGLFRDDDFLINSNWHESGDLADVCFHQGGGLIQGSPLSSAIFQKYCSVVLDGMMIDFCSPRNLVYTRYVDDILISSKRPMKKNLRKILRSKIRSSGFVLNEKKDEVVCIQSKELKHLGAMLYRGRASVTEKFFERFDNTKESENAKPGMKAWMDTVESMNMP